MLPNALAQLQRIQIRGPAWPAQSIAILCQLQRSLAGASAPGASFAVAILPYGLMRHSHSRLRVDSGAAPTQRSGFKLRGPAVDAGRESRVRSGPRATPGRLWDVSRLLVLRCINDLTFLRILAYAISQDAQEHPQIGLKFTRKIIP